MRILIVGLGLVAFAGCQPAAPVASVGAPPAPASRVGQTITLNGGGAYLFRDEAKATDYAGLLGYDGNAAWAYLNDLDGTTEDFHTSTGKPDHLADVVRLYGGSEVRVVQEMPDQLLRVQVLDGITNVVVDGKTRQDHNGNYRNTIGYLIPNQIKAK